MKRTSHELESRPGGAPAARRHRLELALTAILIGAMVLVTHWPVLGARALSLDDDEYVTYNPLVTHPSWESARRFFGEVLKPSSVAGYYQPLAMTSLMLDYAMGGRPGDLRMFHRTSLALHVLSTVLAALVLYRLFGALIPAAIVALLFGLHPLTVEPTAWIAERKALVAACFAFASLLGYVEYARSGARRWRIASVALYVPALLAKSTVVMFPLLLLLLDFWPLRRLRLRSVAEKWPFFLLSLVFGAITLASQHRVGGIAAATPADYARWPLQVGYVLGFYLSKIARPTNLSCIYPPPEPFALSNPAVLLGVLAVCVLTIGLALVSRGTRGPLVGWLFFSFALAPTLSVAVVKYSWVMGLDNYVYFPSLGILLVLASGLTHLWGSPRIASRSRRAAILAAALVVLAAEARVTRAALVHWTDSFALYRHMENIAPRSPVIHNRLGILLEGQSDHEGAVRELKRALELEPAYGDAHYNLGIVLGNLGRIAESIEHFRQAAELLPEYPEAAYNLGASLRLANRLEDAEAQFRRALRLRPDYVEALDQLGSVLALQGRAREAIDPLRAAVTLAPADPLLHFRLGLALVLLGGHAPEAVNQLEQALRQRPDWPEALNALAWLLATSPDPAVRDTTESLRLAIRAVELTGGRSPAILDTRAAAEAAAGRFPEAVATARRALDLARQSDAGSLARGIRDRLRLYERRTAYTEPAGSAPSTR